MTYEILRIELASEIAEKMTYKGVIKIQGRRYRFYLWNSAEPRITTDSFLTLEDDATNTLSDALEKEFEENHLHPHPGIAKEIAGHKFRVRTQLHPQNKQN